MARQEQWQLEGSAAELYERYLVPAITALWAADLVDRAAPRSGERVLDVACGTGVVARSAAERMGSGHVVGLDINTGMLAVARSLPSGAGPRIDWHEGSALEMPFPDSTFDLVLCQLGLQFFPDRSSALRGMFRVLVADGRLALSVFSAIEHTPAAKALADALDRHLGPGASATKRSEHSLADADELYRLVTGAGFRQVTIHTTTQNIRFPSSKEYVRLQLAATPQAGLVSGMDAGQRNVVIAAIMGDVSSSLAIYSTGGELTFPQEAHVVLARK
ncbi:methyltransferase domain-containing protein [Mesorhizobium sp. M6A.T.Cr.TU.017.01.1.1]|uniref:class I SAM-dependent methyltransferase n=1 Tax=Mesorhizobium sp. M6A.T.Cr.TU.017.01.1.1 TaxID=2496774 RepID=UPI000FD47F1B|nr:methyltransferase domain-containing protein [Mesorhizobium sp. M6A.T.Cr.TU.017.01.1.1]RUV03761.1 methyltransferase domain-containing protein [Mesorhizobium sp. M6A.T.Cr.TU.017.01.1.1]